MLMCKIAKLKIIKTGMSSSTLKLIAQNGEEDLIDVDVSESNITVQLLDKEVSSFSFKDNKLSNEVTKVSGALAGGVFDVGTHGASLYNYRSGDNDVFCITVSRNVHEIVLGDFVISVLRDEDFTTPPSFCRRCI